MEYLKLFDEFKCVTRRVAAKDISDYLKSTNTKNSPAEIWNVTSKDIFSKKSKELNKKLGIHKINKKKVSKK